ncbi:hypothetical protein HYU09_01295 [Candidatus Woesearchaeota archaeon]|nr:hypothetical protein [Candidatus Woesearchaeota archaeon]
MSVQGYRPVTPDGVFAKNVVLTSIHVNRGVQSSREIASVCFPSRYDFNDTKLAVRYLNETVEAVLEDESLSTKRVGNQTAFKVENAKSLREIVSAIVSDPSESIWEYARAVKNYYALESTRLFLGSYIALQSAHLDLNDIDPETNPSYGSLLGAMCLHSQRGDGLGFRLKMTMRLDRPTIDYQKLAELRLRFSDKNRHIYNGMAREFDGYCPESCANLKIEAATETTAQEIQDANRWLLYWADGNFDFFPDYTMPLLDFQLSTLLKNIFQDSNFFLGLLDNKPEIRIPVQLPAIEPWKTLKKK